ncbi:MAG: hypothetical protein NVS9B2_01730 [Steroidobacteraceae bacterium]
MPVFFFLAGVLTTLAALVLLLPWLRKMPRLESVPLLPWQASAGAAVIIVLILGSSYRWLGHPGTVSRSAAPSTASENGDSAFGNAAKVFANATGASADAAGSPGSPASPAATPAAGSMGSAIANLEGRLAKGGGTEGDWELLAKSFEFLGRPADAAKARARQLPPLPSQTDASADSPALAPVASSAAAGTATALSGEVMLAPALQPKAAVGGTLFIVAKSVDAPGIPVAVFRGSVGSWPLKFTLDDSQSMMPGRNLSSAGRVTVEARISQKGQPLPAAGDLQGSSGVINPADHRPLKILIDRVIS